MWPRGILSALFGPSGVGKSTALVDIAARITRGDVLPGNEAPCRKGSVIFLAKEDDIESTIKHRLRLAKADQSKVFTIAMEGWEPETRWIDVVDRLDKRLPELERHLKELGDTELVVLNSYNSFTGELDPNKERDMRPFLERLARIAARHDVVIVGVLHPNKKEDLSVKLRASGSGAYINVPRCSIMMARDPNDENRTVMTIIKSQSAKEGDALAFHLSAERQDRSDTVPQLYIKSWEDDWFTVDVEELLQRPKEGRMDKAKKAIEGWLANGPLPVRRLQSLCEGEGINWNTVMAMRQNGKLKVKSTAKIVKGERRYVWQL